MGWKEFFRLNWIKFGIAVLLMIIGFFVFMAAFGCGFGMSPSFFCENVVSILVYTFGLGFALGTRLHYSLFGTDAGFFYWAIILQLIYSYLISCVIYWIFGKIKSKKQDN
ncbi:hypothetical protein FJZ17_03055 [Candidatus Pacearchaeota archaeon]|nr:hypothetical protein [Candidatus Pacearchaeota archaeon]